MSEPTFPVFIGIGAQKAGTSWLHECLKKHDQIWLPPEKEIHYFDRNPSYPSPNFLYPDQPLKRWFGKEFWNQIYRDKFKDVLKNQFKDKKVFRWYMKYLLLPCSDEWYASLFEEGRNLIRGEITPSYSILNELDVKHVHSVMPECKIVFILRNPVERAWSQFRFLVRMGRMNPEANFDEFKNWVDSPDQRDRSAYLETIARWSNLFGEKQMLVCFYDDIVNEPKELLGKVLAFLGARSDDTAIGAILERGKVNVSPEIDIPEQFQQYLREKYASDLAEMAAELGGPARLWLEESPVS